MRASPYLSLFSIFALSVTASAQPQTGKELYGLYCGACHGVDGVGAASNPNPPLAGSEWLTGEPDRAAAAVIKGLMGPVEVKGSSYNLMMPPQGGILQDEQLAKILTYIRTSFGNTESPVSSEQIAAVRAAVDARTTPWTAHELKEAYPIVYPEAYPKLDNLIATVYHGKWEVMPDFSQLEAASAEEEASNLISLAQADRTKEVGIVWTGDLIGDDQTWSAFSLNASDGARFYINDELKLEVKGVGQLGSERSVTKSVNLPAGKHTFRMEYFSNNSDSPGIVLKVEKGEKVHYLTESRLTTTPGRKPIMITPPADGAIVYKNFIKGASPKAIGVGYGAGVNLAFSPEHLGPDLMWTGAFMDGGRHWSQRGQGFEPPAGSFITKLQRVSGYMNLGTFSKKFLGYSLDKNDIPTFRYQIGTTDVSEHYTPSPKGFERTITYTPGGDVPSELTLILADTRGFEAREETSVAHYSGLSITAPSALTVTKEGEATRATLPVALNSDGSPTTITITYTWTNL